MASDGWGGSGKTGSYCQLLPNSTSLKSLQRVLIMSLFFLRVFEAAYAEKASSSFLRILSFFRSATVFTAHFGGRRAVIGREGKRERWRAHCVPLSLSLVGQKVVFC